MLEKLKEFAKKHPVALGAIVLFVGGVFILLLRGRTSGQTSAATQASSVAALSLQEQQLEAATGLQQSQIQSQLSAAQYAAQVQNTQTDAALKATNIQTEAGLIETLATNQTQNAANTDAAHSYDLQNSLEANVAQHTIDAQLQGLQTEVGASVTTNQLQAQLEHEYLSTQANLEADAMKNSAAIDQHILGEVDKAGLNHGTSSLENTLAGIIAEVEGQQGPAEAAFGASASSAAAAAAGNASIWSGILNFGKSATGLLFG